MSAALPEQTGALAETLLAGDVDPFDVLEKLQPLMHADTFTAVCEAMEVCPVHVRDAAICADDMADCGAGRS